MTIITAKRPHRALLLTPLALAALLLSAECRADWKFSPTVGVTETYTDNPSLQRDELAHAQFVSEAMAGFALTEKSPRLRLSAVGRVHQFAYTDGNQPNLNDREHDYSANALAKLTDDVFLDMAASGGPQNISAFGPQVNDNLYSMGNRTTINTWRISPYVQHRYGSVADMLLRYSRDGVDAGARNPFGSSTASTGSLNLNSGTAFHTVGWGLSYTHQDMQNRLGGPSSSENAVADLRWRYSPQISATASVGYDTYDYKTLGGRTAGRNWSGGFIWSPSSRTSVQASFGRHYFGKTGSLVASHRSRQSVWSINYSDAITTTRQQFLLPSTIDTASLIDSLLGASIPDPVLRQQAVQTYLQASGLPPSLANNVNYLSNRYLRQKQLQAAVAFNWAHSSLVTSLNRTERTALSLRESDSALLGSQLSTLNDNVRQRSLNSVFSYRLTSRTIATATATLDHITSLDTGIKQVHRQLRVGMTRRVERRMSVALDMRHVEGSNDVATGGRYSENAITATLSAQF
ncbi:TIGR03016 family PEP-CTERM system-associated outer membrane protein [Massilia sp. LXY-6]|uniref:TIGR03016 family PEP-CTERM system-associated outer membrane protein n=1 Tax=Massilia sp. LXY-6 TaxID=3379823 RepID=UPI003EDE91C1